MQRQRENLVITATERRQRSGLNAIAIQDLTLTQVIAWCLHQVFTSFWDYRVAPLVVNSHYM